MRSHRVLRVLAFGLFAAVLTVQVLRVPRCTIDEPAWITSGVVTYDLVRAGAAPSTWGTAYDGLHDWGHKNPPLGKLLIGAAVRWSGTSGPVRYYWQWGHSYAENLAAGQIPPAAILTPARLAIAASAWLVLVGLYVFAQQMGAGSWAIVAPLALFALPVYQFHATHVYTDLPQLAGIVWSACALARYAATRRRVALWLAAIAAGAACAVKFSAAPSVLVVLLVALRVEVQWRARLMASLTAGLLAWGVFVAVNPYLYPAPISRSLALVEAWRDSKAAQQADLPEQAITSRREAIAHVAARAVFWPHRTPPFSNDLASSPLLDLGVGVVVVLGLVPMCRTRDAVWGAAFLAHLGATVWWLPFDWARYYLPVIIWIGPALAVSARRLQQAVTVRGGLFRRAPQARRDDPHLIPRRIHPLDLP